jgi:hypothetical protein
MILILNKQDLRREKAKAELAMWQPEDLKYSMRPIEMADLVLVQDGFHGPFKVLKSRISLLKDQTFECDDMMRIIQSHI